ncbi:MAG: putative RhaS protein [Bacteroidetes bacterium]|nr:putative RhaS protein [Bacteroidota bacterium]
MKTYDGIELTYDARGNITDHPGIGEQLYSKYQLALVRPTADVIPETTQEITYNALQRPESISEGSYQASFTYNADGDRVLMKTYKDSSLVSQHYYLGGQYEVKTQGSSTKEIFYLDGDRYSASSALVRENGNNWNIYYICRDYLGSVTQVTDADGNLEQELSYDPWGRMRNPENQEPYAVYDEPTPFLGIGYTGHEHLTEFGLINMNARLYDPTVGRFLSPDPYIQAPDFSQNFNRYSYCLNNPLKYTDASGKSIGLAIALFALFSAGKTYNDGYRANGNEFNPFKWTVVPTITLSYGFSSDGSGTYSAGIGYNDNPFMVGYTTYSGWGVGTQVNGYTVLLSTVSKIENGLNAAADYVDEQISSFSWSDTQYAIPVWAEARMAANASDRGNAYFAEGDYGYAALSYVEALSWDIMGAADLLTIGRASQVRSLITSGGELIAKGGRYLYGKFAVAEGAAAKGGLTNPQLVQKSATLAERAIGGTGGVAGTAKHQYASKLLNRYQSIYGNRGLETGLYFNNGVGNRGFLDVIDHTNGIIYDFKFGKAVMSPAQYNKYFSNFGLPIQVIRP